MENKIYRVSPTHEVPDIGKSQAIFVDIKDYGAWYPYVSTAELMRRRISRKIRSAIQGIINTKNYDK